MSKFPVEIVGDYQGKTPIFRIKPPTHDDEPWCRVYASNKQNGEWFYPGFYPYGYRVFKDLRAMAPNLRWTPSALEHVKTLHPASVLWDKTLKEFQEGKDIALPDWFEYDRDRAPFPHQRLGIIKMLTWWRGLFLWDMGTGKTRTLIEGFKISRRERPDSRLLVLSPPVVIPTWQKEVDTWAKNQLHIVHWDGSESSAREAQNAQIVVLTYARARIEENKRINGDSLLSELSYTDIAGDESHSLGSIDAEQTRAVLQLSSRADRRWLLSGTAADNPGKLYAQFRFLSPALLNGQSWTDYKKKYFIYSTVIRGQVYGYKGLETINWLVDSTATRMKKKDVLKHLPPVQHIDVPFDLTSEQVREYNACVARLREYERAMTDPEFAGHGTAVAHGGALANKLLQVVSGFLMEGSDLLICNGCEHLSKCVDADIRPYTSSCQVVQVKPPTTVRRFHSEKRTVFEELVRNVLADGDPNDPNKIICWGSYLTELDDMEEVLKKIGVGYVRIDGSNTKHIGDAANKFQTDPECRVYLGQVRSGVGITLTAANYMIYYALSWDFVANKQSLDRNNRPGQTRNMTVYRLISTLANGMDRFLAKTLEFKDRIAYTLLEQISCSGCDRREDCTKTEIRPFTQGCKYQDKVAKPISSGEYVQLRTSK